MVRRGDAEWAHQLGEGGEGDRSQLDAKRSHKMVPWQLIGDNTRVQLALINSRTEYSELLLVLIDRVLLS